MGKFFKGLFIFLLIIVVLAGVADVYLMISHNVEVISFGIQLSDLNKKGSEDEYTYNAFTTEDYTSVNEKLSYTEYTSPTLKLSSKEFASYIDHEIKNGTYDVKINGESASNYNFELMQVTFKDTETSNINIEVIYKIESSSLKEKYFKEFPLSALSGSIPNDLYVTSSIVVDFKDSGTYEVKDSEVRLNTMTATNTKKLINSINGFGEIITIEQLTDTINPAILTAMFGDESHNGVVQTLKSFGAKSFNFKHYDNQLYFVSYFIDSNETRNITFNNTKGSTNTNPTSYKISDEDIILEDISSNGYTFLGWYVGDTKITKIEIDKFENVSLDAKWELITYTITYDLNGGTVTSENPTTYTIETPTFTLINPTKEYAEFSGWIGTGLNGITPSVTIETGTYGNLELSACFIGDTVSLSLYIDNKLISKNDIDKGTKLSKADLNLSKLGFDGYTITFKKADDSTYDFNETLLNDLSLYGTTTYVVDTLTFFPYIEKFSTAVTSHSLTVNSYDELSSWVEYVIFYSISSETWVSLSYSGSKVNDLSQAYQDATKGEKYSANFTTETATQAVLNKVMIRISESTVATDATKTFDPSYTQTLEQTEYGIKSQVVANRANDSKFAVDNLNKKIPVTTSNQLVYVLENGYIPDCASNSQAEKMYNKAKDVLRKICTDDMTSEQKAKEIYEWLVVNVQYDFAAANSNLAPIESVQYDAWYLEGVFNNKKAVCEGYAKAYLVLTRIEGIPSIYVTGNTHAWNRIMINDNWYGVDATHGSGALNISGYQTEYVSFTQFMFTDAYKTNLGYTSEDFKDLKAITAYSPYANINYKFEENTISLCITNQTDLIQLFKLVASTEKAKTSTYFVVEVCYVGMTSIQISSAVTQASIASGLNAKLKLDTLTDSCGNTVIQYYFENK